MAVTNSELRSALTDVRKILDDIEQRLDENQTPEIEPYERRRLILQRIHWSDNDVSRSELNRLLESYGTNYAWIGQQVKKGYLDVKQTPAGQRYSVTQKAVVEQELDDDEEEAELAAWSKAAEDVFAEDWDSEADSIHDSA